MLIGYLELAVILFIIIFSNAAFEDQRYNSCPKQVTIDVLAPLL